MSGGWAEWVGMDGVGWHLGTWRDGLMIGLCSAGRSLASSRLLRRSVGVGVR